MTRRAILAMLAAAVLMANCQKHEQSPDTYCPCRICISYIDGLGRETTPACADGAGIVPPASQPQ